MTITLKTTFEALTCPYANCGYVCALPTDHVNKMRESKEGSYYCPSCRGVVSWNGQSRAKRAEREATQLRESLECSRRQTDYQRRAKESAQRRHSAQKGVVTRMKRRIAHGVCPCCNRHFKDLERHMAGQHPAYTESLK